MQSAGKFVSSALRLQVLAHRSPGRSVQLCRRQCSSRRQAGDLQPGHSVPPPSLRAGHGRVTGGCWSHTEAGGYILRAPLDPCQMCRIKDSIGALLKTHINEICSIKLDTSMYISYAIRGEAIAQAAGEQSGTGRRFTVCVVIVRCMLYVLSQASHLFVVCIHSQ